MAEKAAINDPPKESLENGVWKGIKVYPPVEDFQLGEKLITEMKKYPEIIGQIDGETGKSETYDTIYEKSVRCALWLKKYNVGRNDVIGFCSANNMNTCIPLLASLYIGSIFNPWWNSCLDEEISKFFIEYTRPKVLFVDEKSAKIVLKIINDTDCNVKIIVFGKMSGIESFADILNQASINEIQSFECTKINNANEPAIILYTSGTTSNPKGVLHSYGSITSIMGPMTSKVIVSLWFANLCWLSAVMGIIHAIGSHSTAIVYDSPSEEVACKLIQKFKVTRLSMGTAVANRLSKMQQIEKYNVSSVNFCFFAGSIAKKEVVEFLIKLFKNAIIVTGYGSTECMATGGIVNAIKPTSCGRVYKNHEIKVIDSETNEVVGANKRGELWCRGSTLMKYYWNNPTATNAVVDSDGWYHTGDVGYYDDDGDFFIVERIKELIKYRLHHVPPAAIECVVQDIPGVREVAVVAKPHIDDQEQPTAFITKVPGVEITEDDVHKVVNDRLHDRMKLRGGVYFLDEMPYTPSGKIAKRELRALAKAHAQW